MKYFHSNLEMTDILFDNRYKGQLSNEISEIVYFRDGEKMRAYTLEVYIATVEWLLQILFTFNCYIFFDFLCL